MIGVMIVPSKLNLYFTAISCLTEDYFSQLSLQLQVGMCLKIRQQNVSKMMYGIFEPLVKEEILSLNVHPIPFWKPQPRHSGPVWTMPMVIIPRRWSSNGLEATLISESLQEQSSPSTCERFKKKKKKFFL